MQKGFTFLDHPTELRAEIHGETLQELFKNSALALMSYRYPTMVNVTEHEIHDTIKITAEHEDELLVDFLSEIIVLSNSRDICYNEFNFKKITDQEIIADIWGRRARANHKVHGILGATTHIAKNKFGYQTQIVFDI